ncbi:hypothetical protein MUK42_32602 [Musa troglodytarum]|uniref:Uncharacterized protein n=1 Tax=Musa troglodytarum TaxID=320322 RepID=A0A9E7JFV9_9LILI|nr:hypothetical protein MUK42_32602 [Musa troglodytarum]
MMKTGFILDTVILRDGFCSAGGLEESLKLWLEETIIIGEHLQQQDKRLHPDSVISYVSIHGLCEKGTLARHSSDFYRVSKEAEVLVRDKELMPLFTGLSSMVFVLMD